MKEIVYTRTVELSRDSLQYIIDYLNEVEFNPDNYDEDELQLKENQPLTLEEVESKPRLLAYIANILEYDPKLEDLQAHWNGDGWIDIKKYR